MIHYTEKLWRYFSWVMFLTVCFTIAACIVTFAYGSAISVQEVGKQVMLSFFSVLVFIVVLLLCRMVYHLSSHRKNSHRSSYHEFINELEKALDRIAQGDFEVRVATKKDVNIVHASGKGAKYTRTFAAVELVYFEEVADKSAALKREYALKQLKKEDKEALVSTMDTELLEKTVI